MPDTLQYGLVVFETIVTWIDVQPFAFFIIHQVINLMHHLSGFKSGPKYDVGEYCRKVQM